MTTKRAREIIKRNKHEFGMLDSEFRDAVKVLFEASKKLDDIEHIVKKCSYSTEINTFDAMEKIIGMVLGDNNEK